MPEFIFPEDQAGSAVTPSVEMPPAVSVPAETLFLQKILMGPQGIRAGWSIAIFITLMGIFAVISTAVLQRILGSLNPMSGGSIQPLPMILSEGMQFLCVFLAALIMTCIEHKPLISYGLEGRRRPLHFVYGLFFGLLALSALVGALKLSGVLVFDGQQVFGHEALKYAALWGVGFFLVGISEEYMMRGYMQATLTRGLGFWWGALILSTLFGCMHLGNAGESHVGIFSAAAVGLVFCISLYYLKSLWWAIGFHTSWDWAQSYLYGTADSGTMVQGHLFACHPQGKIIWSGGATGPEGSLLIIPLLIIAAALMYVAWGRTKAEVSEAVVAE